MPKEEAKLYYSIGEVADMFSVNTSLIRFWEKEFDIIKPRKSKKGTRYFTRKDVDNFHLIYNLLKERKFTINGAKEYLANNPEKSTTDFELLKTLKELRTFLIDIRDKL